MPGYGRHKVGCVLICRQNPANQVTVWLNTHRHNDIFEVGIVRNGNKGRRIGIAQFDTDFIVFQVPQYIKQIGDVETDVDIVAGIVEFDFLDGFFLIGVCRTDLDASGCQNAADSLEFVARHDGGSLQGFLQLFTRNGEAVFVSLRNDACIVGELAFDQFGNQFDITENETDLCT